ncbi:actin-like ATPase domain-containing protein [Aureobasidium pullulans]|nr:actin-like ATPase domain-containing protein [Aureobasidium pullulans]
MPPWGARRDRLVVGLDFGTTFSGCAGVKRTAAGDPALLNSPRWGFQIKPNELRLHYIKLLLDHHQRLPPYVSRQHLAGLLLRWDKSAEQAVSDYLTALFSHAKTRLERRFPLMVATTQIDIVITVPAVWSDAAKDVTMRAAEKAGMGENLFMVSEPEAAAIYAMKSIDVQQKLCETGDNFILCDAGGGTVDLASFEVASVSPLRLVESAPGFGALCGSVFLNLKFQDLVRRRMGADDFQSFCDKNPGAWAVAHKYFEDYVKRNFDPVDHETEFDDGQFNVPFPGVKDNLAAGIMGSFITLTNADVSEIFRPIVDKVIELVERQRNVLAAHGKTAKGLILVGGFGASCYLYRCLKSRFADEDPPPSYTSSIEESATTEEEVRRFIIMQPENSWTAVVRGAVLTGLERDLVVSRKARRHYGVVCNAPWDPSLHSPKNKFVDRITKELGAKNQMLCLTEDRWPGEGSGSESSARIIVSDAEVPPQEYEPTNETRVLCTLSTDLDEIPRKHFRRRMIHGQTYYSLDWKLGMTFDERLTFDQRIDDEVYGSIEAVYT